MERLLAGAQRAAPNMLDIFRLLRSSPSLALAALLILPPAALGAPDEAVAVRRMLLDASRALQATNAALFLSHFDPKRFPDVGRFRADVSALMQQKDIASSIDIRSITPQESGYAIELDWLLQLTPNEQPGRVETRREEVAIRVARGKNGRWRIVKLEPRGLFEPSFSRPGGSRER